MTWEQQNLHLQWHAGVIYWKHSHALSLRLSLLQNRVSVPAQLGQPVLPWRAAPDQGIFTRQCTCQVGLSLSGGTLPCTVPSAAAPAPCETSLDVRRALTFQRRSGPSCSRSSLLLLLCLWCCWGGAVTVSECSGQSQTPLLGDYRNGLRSQKDLLKNSKFFSLKISTNIHVFFAKR